MIIIKPMKYVFAILMLIHGLIHLMGFVKGFELAEITGLTKSVTRSAAVFWLITALLFTIGTVLYLMDKSSWLLFMIPALICSQILIIGNWHETRYGTIANILILIGVVVGVSGWVFERSFKQDVILGSQNTQAKEESITIENIDHLPPIVQKYLHFTGVVGKLKPSQTTITMKGKMRERGKDWFAFTSKQYNFYDQFERLFFMKARMKGIPVYGYHRYKGPVARMLVKICSLIPVVDIGSELLFKAETVTVLNDLCIFSPGALIDRRFSWNTLGELTVEVKFKNKGHEVRATLYFDEDGRLINFVSDDRISVDDMKYHRFSTPILEYQSYGDYYLPAQGQAIWHYPEGEFIYGIFDIQSIEYNP